MRGDKLIPCKSAEFSPFFDAIQKGRLRQAKLIAEAGADVNSRNERGETPLMWAITNVQDQTRRKHLVRLLLDSGADPNSPDLHGVTPLIRSVLGSDPDLFHVIKRAKGVDITVSDNDGNTVLMYAAALGFCDIVSAILSTLTPLQLLLVIGQKNDQGLSALELAQLNSHSDVVHLLGKESQVFPKFPAKFPDPSLLDRERTPSPGGVSPEVKLQKKQRRRSKRNNRRTRRRWPGKKYVVSDEDEEWHSTDDHHQLRPLINLQGQESKVSQQSKGWQLCFCCCCESEFESLSPIRWEVDDNSMMAMVPRPRCHVGRQRTYDSEDPLALEDEAPRGRRRSRRWLECHQKQQPRSISEPRMGHRRRAKGSEEEFDRVLDFLDSSIRTDFGGWENLKQADNDVAPLFNATAPFSAPTNLQDGPVALPPIIRTYNSVIKSQTSPQQIAELSKSKDNNDPESVLSRAKRTLDQICGVSSNNEGNRRKSSDIDLPDVFVSDADNESSSRPLMCKKVEGIV